MRCCERSGSNTSSPCSLRSYVSKFQHVTPYGGKKAPRSAVATKTTGDTSPYHSLRGSPALSGWLPPELAVSRFPSHFFTESLHTLTLPGSILTLDNLVQKSLWNQARPAFPSARRC